MDQVVANLVPGRFMGTVLVAHGDQVLLSKGYGSANLEWQLPNAPSTKFQLASITKQFTAASILLLEEQGKLNVDDPIKKYLSDAPAAWDKITTFNLLTHTAGIPTSSDVDFLAGSRMTPQMLVARFRDKPLGFEPGADWNYSSAGYVLLGYLIEEISGQSYERFLQEHIFTPLGMKDSGYGSHRAIIARRAAGYGAAPDGPVNASFMEYANTFAAGALYSTTEPPSPSATKPLAMPPHDRLRQAVGKSTQNIRSRVRRVGRLTVRCNVRSWCLSARFSSTTSWCPRQPRPIAQPQHQFEHSSILS
jgi:CubicO group peptidase (beta-lactamase class C family)